MENEPEAETFFGSFAFEDFLDQSSPVWVFITKARWQSQEGKLVGSECTLCLWCVQCYFLNSETSRKAASITTDSCQKPELSAVRKLDQGHVD